MSIICNAKTIVDMCLKRLCSNADIECRKVFLELRNKMNEIDEDLVKFMVPQCVYRCGLCPEWKCCGYVKTDKFKKDFKEYIKGFENQYSFNELWKD